MVSFRTLNVNLRATVAVLLLLPLSLSSISVDIAVGPGEVASLEFDLSSDVDLVARNFVDKHGLRTGEGCKDPDVECVAKLLARGLKQRVEAERLERDEAASRGTTDPLVRLGMKHNVDKFLHHGYHLAYGSVVHALRHREPPITMLEIGVEFNRSLALWDEFFPGATLVAFDIGSWIMEVNSTRLKVLRGDQTDESFLGRVVNSVGGANFDLIIDDGSHHPAHQLASFSFLFSEGLREGGTYIIEDTETSYWEQSSGYGLDSMSGIALDIEYGYQHPRSAINAFRELAHHVNLEYLSPAARETHLNRVETNQVLAPTRLP